MASKEKEQQLVEREAEFASQFCNYLLKLTNVKEQFGAGGKTTAALGSCSKTGVEYAGKVVDKGAPALLGRITGNLPPWSLAGVDVVLKEGHQQFRNSRERKKNKKIFSLVPQEKSDAMVIFVKAAVKLFRIFECQFSNVIADREDNRGMRAMSKLAEDAAERVQNYVLSLTEKERKDVFDGKIFESVEEGSDFIFNAVLQGSSNSEFHVKGVYRGSTVEFRYENSGIKEMNTTELFENSGYIEEKDDGTIVLYELKERDKSDKYEYGYKRILLPNDKTYKKDKYDSRNYTCKAKGLQKAFIQYEYQLTLEEQEIKTRAKELVEKEKGDKPVKVKHLKPLVDSIEFIKESINASRKSELESIKESKNDYRKSELESIRESKNDYKKSELGSIKECKNDYRKSEHTLKGKKWWPVDKNLTKSLHKRKTGEKLLVEELHERLLRDENRMVVICESADASKLTGKGGVGKTLTANWYAHHYESEYDHVIWINCGENSLLESFKSLARDLEVKNREELPTVEEFSQKCYEYLEEFKCLWVFDNAENYRGKDGIKKVLPVKKNNFYCLITSRWTEWGTENIGHGQISRLELSIFGESESLEFLKAYLNEKIKYTEYQLKELCVLLGNLPLALQLAVAMLNNGKINLKDYIEATSLEDVDSIVNEKLDDYEKTIHGNIKISLREIEKEINGKFANDILTILGYIQPDNIQTKFLLKVMKVDLNILKEAICLLEKYALVSKTGTLQETPYDDGIMNRVLGRRKLKVEMDLLSIHRLLQQVMRHIGRETENETLRKIFGCYGFLDYKLIPFTKYANEELRKEYRKIKAELLDQQQLKKLLREERFKESVQLARFIDKELQKDVTKFNYAVCLEWNGQFEDGIKLLEELYQKFIKEERFYSRSVEMGLLQLKEKVSKSLVGVDLVVSHWKMDNKKRVQEILEDRLSLRMNRLQDTVTTLSAIVNSNFEANYTLTNDEPMFKISLGGDTKTIFLKQCSVDVSIGLPNNLQKLVLTDVHFKDGIEKDSTLFDVGDWLPKKLNTLNIFCKKEHQLILPLECISSIENITLWDCGLSLNSVSRISPKELKLERVYFTDNKQVLENVKINDVIDFHKMKRLEIICMFNKNLSIDLSEEESANIEYLHLDDMTVLSLKSEHGRVNIKEAKIEDCSLDLSILPPSLEKLKLPFTKVFLNGRIELPNLKYLQLENTICHLSHFRSLQLTHLYLNGVEEVNVDLLPPTVKIIRIDRDLDFVSRLLGGMIHLDKLILSGFPLNEVEEVLTHFLPKEIVLYSGHSSYKPVVWTKLMDRQIAIFAIGKVDWGWGDFNPFLLSKQNRQSKYYVFQKGTGKAIEEQDFQELYFNEGHF